MKRDMDLIRRILLELEKLDKNGQGANLNFEGVDERHVMYQLSLMDEAGLIVADAVIADGEFIPTFIGVNRITWKGHDFLDMARSSTIWNRTKQKIGETVETVGFAVLIEFLKATAMEVLGVHSVATE